MNYICCIVLSLLCCPSFALTSFPEAKRVANQLFSDHRQTLYCHCNYNQSHEIDLNSCGMTQAEAIKRAKRSEWEHMMPAENFGRHLLCWREKICTRKGKTFKGRKCCEKIDPTFRQMEGELYNLWPSVGLVNEARSNYRYSTVRPLTKFYGCAFAIDKAHRQVEPDDLSKGIVARANLFMSDHFNIRLSPAQEKLFIAWDKQFPPSVWECEWAHRVEQKEGYSNPFIAAHC